MLTACPGLTKYVLITCDLRNCCKVRLNWRAEYRASPVVNPIQFRQEPDAFLFIRVGTGNDGDAGLGLAGIVGKVGPAGRDVDEIAATTEGRCKTEDYGAAVIS